MTTNLAQKRLATQLISATLDRSMLVVASSNHKLQTIRTRTGEQIGSSAQSNPAGSEHTGLIRSIVILPDNSAVITTGEDKQLKTWELPTLKLMNTRQLLKRASSLVLSPDHKNIIIGDRSGDIYDLPLEAPLDTVFRSDPDQPEAGGLRPIAGHVSILTSMIFIEHGPILVSADRDEHIRLSRYPKSWSIYGFLLGHLKFVSALDYLQSHQILISGGGDHELFICDPINLRLLRKVDVRQLSEGLKVSPQKPDWYLKSKRTNQRRQKKQQEEKEKLQEEETNEDQTLQRPKKVCINKIIHTNHPDPSAPSYVLVTSMGSSTLAIIPMPVLLGIAELSQVRYHDFGSPILDIVNITSDSQQYQFLLSLDSADNCCIRAIEIDGEIIKEVELNGALSSMNQSINQYPSQVDIDELELYPDLILLNKSPIDQLDKKQNCHSDLGGGRTGFKETCRKSFGC